MAKLVHTKITKEMEKENKYRNHMKTITFLMVCAGCYIIFIHITNCLLCVCFYLFMTSRRMPVRLKDSPMAERTRLQYASWLGNTTSLVIVVSNDIYLRQSPANEEDVRLTHTGQPDLIYNGLPDWLYQGKI